MGCLKLPRRRVTTLFLVLLVGLVTVYRMSLSVASQGHESAPWVDRSMDKVKVKDVAKKVDNGVNVNMHQANLLAKAKAGVQYESAARMVQQEEKQALNLADSYADHGEDDMSVLETDNPAGVDLAQMQILDLLNGESESDEYSKSAQLFGGSLLSNSFSLKSAWKTAHAYALGTRHLQYNRTDFLEMGRRARALRIAYTLLHDKKDMHVMLASLGTPHFNLDKDSKSLKLAKMDTQLKAIVSSLEQLMYPWLSGSRFKNIHALQTFAKDGAVRGTERGIILSTGRGHFELAIHVIVSLRNVLNCNLPIEVHHMGPDDLDSNMLSAFRALPGVKTVDVWDYWGEEAKQIGGWAVKPFALLASNFTQVMFIDADAVFVQSPEVLFTKSEIFKKYGQLFYHDRTITGYDQCRKWFNGFVPYASKYSESLRFQKKDTVHEQESGVVLIDKSRTDVLHALLTTAKMNMKVERDGITYKMMHGDKESYWMSWELVRVPYKFSTGYGGTIGYKNDDNAVCGGLYHTDEYLKPLWWNGGVVANKHVKKTEGLLQYEYAAYDLEGKDIRWDWETATTPFCLRPKFAGQKVVVSELTAAEVVVTKKLVQLYKGIIDVGWKSYMKDNYGWES
ncbi:hypothetical protein HDU78_003241 [Chytriomyces hyalinus]|nr:hypothetical protein HDU78_003241 [Chytriomyces hyalinus]